MIKVVKYLGNTKMLFNDKIDIINISHNGDISIIKSDNLLIITFRIKKFREFYILFLIELLLKIEIIYKYLKIRKNFDLLLETYSLKIKLPLYLENN